MLKGQRTGGGQTFSLQQAQVRPPAAVKRRNPTPGIRWQGFLRRGFGSDPRRRKHLRAADAKSDVGGAAKSVEPARSAQDEGDAPGTKLHVG